MSDWNKFVSFTSSKEANAVLFLLVCVILIMVFFRSSNTHYTGGQRGGCNVTWFLTILSFAITVFCVYILSVVFIYKK